MPDRITYSTVLLSCYAIAVAAANLLAATYGPPAVLPVAFLLIGATLVIRDRLHDTWQGRQFAVRMGATILAGAALSYMLNAGAGRIALASALAFLTAEAADALIYQAQRRRPWIVRSNTSNAVSALLDSAVFIVVAFGGPWPLILAQWAVKVAGGALWSVVLAPRRRTVAAPA